MSFDTPAFSVLGLFMAQVIEKRRFLVVTHVHNACVHNVELGSAQCSQHKSFKDREYSCSEVGIVLYCSR